MNAPLLTLWLIAGTMIAALAVFAANPTLRDWQRRIIVVRAAWMTAGEMWREAWFRGRNVWPEMLRRAKYDA